MSKFSKNFFLSLVTADASMDANANCDDVSVIAYNTELPKPFFRLNSYYILWKELRRLYDHQTANKIIEMQLIGDIYIHDFHGVAAGMPYCFNYSTYDIMTMGLPMVKKIKSIPPKHLYAFKSQLEQFTVIASNSTLGATGLADLFIVMSYYYGKILKTGNDAGFYLDGWFSDNERSLIMTELLQIESIRDKENDIEGYLLTSDDYDQIDNILKKINNKLNKTKPAFEQWFNLNVDKYIRENIISFMYTINQPMRANQSPFTNVSVYDDVFLTSLCSDYIFPDGTYPEKKLINNLQRMYLNVVNIEMRRTPLTFPITTACFSVDENNNINDKVFLKFIAEQDKEFGFINFYCGDSSTLSSCCRLRSDKKNEYFNSFGSGSSKIGSLGVCSINFPRLAIKYPNEEDFMKHLIDMIGVCAKINNAKRKIIAKRIKNGNEPLYTLGFMDINKQYSTVGVNGFNECIELLGKDILSKEGQQLGIRILDTINNTNDKYQKQYNAPHNTEMVPAENMSIKMAEKDKYFGYQDKYDIYSNQFIPLTTNADMLDRIKLQGIFDKHFSGGAIMHLNCDSKIEKIEDIMNLIAISAKKGVVYFAINYNLQECENGHMSVGKGNVCSICGKSIINNYTRVVGFLTNTKNWHKVRREKDYPNRQFYNNLNIKENKGLYS